MVGALLLPAVPLRRGRDWTEALALGAAFSVIFWGGLALAHFLLVLPSGRPRTVGLVALLAALGGGALLIRVVGTPPRSPAHSDAAGSVFLVAGGVAVLTLGLEASLPHYVDTKFFYDWWMHFDLARFYWAPTDFDRIYLDGASVPSRTPFFNLLGALVLSHLGDRFAVFQAMTAALGWLWVLPCALLARRLALGAATPLIGLLGLSPLILHSHTYAWPKGLVAFLLLLALERFLALRQQPSAEGGPLALQFGLCSGAAVMAHAGFSGYLLPLFALLFWDARRGRRSWRAAAGAALTAGAVVLPWYAWATAQYGFFRGLFGYPRFPYASAWSWAADHFFTLASSVFPISLPLGLLTGTLDPWQGAVLTYLGTAAGLLGVGALVRVLAQNLQPRLRIGGAHAQPVLAFAVVGMVTATVLLQPLVRDNADAVFIPALVALALLSLRAAPAPRWLLRLALSEAIAVQGSVLVWLWSPLSNTQGNAQLAALHQIRFLAADAWPVGLVLLVTGAALCVLALRPCLVSEARTPRVARRAA